MDKSGISSPTKKLSFAPHKIYPNGERNYLVLLITIPLLTLFFFSMAVFQYGSPGFQVDKTRHGLLVSNIFAGHNPVLPGDLIIAINNVPYTKVLGSLLIKLPDQRYSKASITIKRNRQTFTFTPNIIQIHWPTFLNIFWPQLLLITLLLVLGSIALLYAAPEQPADLFFYSLCGFATTIATTIPSHFGLLQPRIISLSFLEITLSNWLAFGAFAHFICRFPKERDLCISRPFLSPIFYILPAAISLTGAFYTAGFTASFFSELQRFRNICLPVIIVGSFLKHYVDQYHLDSPFSRNQIKLFLNAYWLSFAPYLVFYLLPNLIYDRPIISFKIVVLAATILPATYLLALIRYRLLGVDRFISRTIAYVFVILSLSLLYTLSLAVLKHWFFGRNTLSEGIFLIFLIVIAVGFNPLINKIQQWIDKYFFRYRPNDNTLVFEFSRKLASTLQLSRLIVLITEKLPQEMQITKSACLLLGEKHSRLYPTHLRLGSHLWQESALIKQFNQGAQVLFCQEQQEDSQLTQELSELHNAGFSLALPLRGINKLIGVIFIGQRKDGGFFREHDISLLATLANQAALALSNSLQYTSLVKSKEQLETLFSKVVQTEKMAALGEISATLAHEIKNPLAIIRSSAQYLAEDKPEPEIHHEMLQYIIDEVDGLNEIIGNILDLARYKNPRLKSIDLEQYIPLLCNQWINSDEHNPDVHITWLVANGLPLLYADPQQLRQVLLNVIQNSEDAMDTGGNLSLKVEKEQQFAMFYLQDDGRGIPEEHTENLFKKFFTTKKNGLGLGLSVCEQIVRAHQGSITIRNRQKRGTEVLIRLPFQPILTSGPD